MNKYTLIALTILLSLVAPSLFAESFKSCRYSHQEYNEAGEEVGERSYYATMRVPPTYPCPEPPADPDLDHNHEWTTLTYSSTDADKTVSYSVARTADGGDCKLDATAYIYREIENIK